MSDAHLYCELGTEMVLWLHVHFCEMWDFYLEKPQMSSDSAGCASKRLVQIVEWAGRDLKGLVPTSLLWGGTPCTSPGCSGN